MSPSSPPPSSRPPHHHHQQKRKKWTEAEERSLLDKYAEMASDGSLSRLQTREKRFRPIASHVNSLHHLSDPSSFPFLWSWKDASTKVQNMRHQYLLVKQKLVSSSQSQSPSLDPLSLWPNFHRYRDVFGDPPDPLPIPPSDIDEDNAEAPPRKTRRRKKVERAWGIVKEMIAGLKEREELLAEREQDDTEAREERARRRSEEEREWEEGLERRRAEWRRRMEGAMVQHRAEIEQMQARLLHDQQAIMGQLLGVVAQWGGGGGGLGDAAAISGGQQPHHNSTYFSHMMHGLTHMSGMDQGEVRVVGGDSQEDQFIVDG